PQLGRVWRCGRRRVEGLVQECRGTMDWMAAELRIHGDGGTRHCNAPSLGPQGLQPVRPRAPDPQMSDARPCPWARQQSKSRLKAPRSFDSAPAGQMREPGSGFPTFFALCRFTPGLGLPGDLNGAKRGSPRVLDRVMDV